MGLARSVAGSLPSISSFNNLGSMMGRPTRSACQTGFSALALNKQGSGRTVELGNASPVLSAGEEVDEQVVWVFREDVSTA